MFRSSDNDPLAAAIAPPQNETPEARAARLRAEAEARRVSDEIDEQLKQERASRRRHRPYVKVLLLGQSESGELSPFSPKLGINHLTVFPSLSRLQANQLRSKVSILPLASFNSHSRSGVTVFLRGPSEFPWCGIALGASFVTLRTKLRHSIIH